VEIRRWIRNQFDRAVAVALAIAGLVAIILGWVGVSGSLLPSQQIPYLASGGLLGLFLLGAAATIWLSADLRDEWRKLDELAEDVRRVAAQLDRGGDEHNETAAEAAINGEGKLRRTRGIAPLRPRADA